MPSPPEVGETDRRVRKAEVVGHGEAQAHGRADRGGRIAGEVAEDLPAEGQRADPGIERAGDALAGVVDHLGRRREEAVGQHDLLEQAERHQRQAEAQLVARGAARLRELRHQLGRAHDRAGDEVREEGHEQRVVEEMVTSTEA